jgi:hypothetical protein
MWQLVVSVEKQLYATEAGLFWLELEPPFYVLRGPIGVIERGGRGVRSGGIEVSDLGRNLVGCDAYSEYKY